MTDLLTNFVISLLGVFVLFLLLLLDDEGVSDYRSYYDTLLSLFSIHFVISSIGRYASITGAKRKLKTGKRSFNTLIIGSNIRALETWDNLNNINKAFGLRFIGYLHVFSGSEDCFQGQLRHWGDLKNLEKVVRRCYVERVIIAIEPSEHQKIADILARLDTSKIKVSVIPDIYSILIGSVRVSHLFGVPLVDIKQQLMPSWQLFVKRTFDIVFSILVLIIGFPFYFTVAVITKLSSPGPVFYMQERIGKSETPFLIYKFRSMYIGSENSGPKLSSTSDSRITGWGKFMRKTRIDELPQFLNVLKGEMSVVGPRPERRFFIEQIEKRASHYRRLLQVRPGITSLGQVKYGYAENVNEMVKRLEFDVLYIENMSLAMDLRIILTTIIIVFQGRGK